jgi:hypothetical protein
MPPPRNLSPYAPEQRRSPLRITDWPKVVMAPEYSAAAPPPRLLQLRDTVSNASSTMEGLKSALDGTAIAGIVAGCIFGAMIFVWALYCCWKLGPPHLTYFETAKKINKRRAVCQCLKRERCLRHPYRRIEAPGGSSHTAVLNIRPPEAAKSVKSTKSSRSSLGSCFDDSHCPV